MRRRSSRWSAAVPRGGDGGVRRARWWLAGYLVFTAVLTIPPVIEPWLLHQAVHLVRGLSGPAAPETGPWVEPLLNVVLFAPLAFLLCSSIRRLSRLEVWLLCVLASACVELTQYLVLPGRVGSVVDVVTNSTGAALGVLAHRLVHGAPVRQAAEAADGEG